MIELALAIEPLIQNELTSLSTAKAKIDKAIVYEIEKPSFDEFILPLYAKQEQDCITINGMLVGRTCIPPPPPPAVQTPTINAETPQTASPAPTGTGLVGSYGYLSPLGNCVAFVNQFGKNQNGNPSNWVASSYTPYIGAAALFTWNHTGIVMGIWSNGDLEIAHANCWGCPTRYPAASFRGFF